MPWQAFLRAGSVVPYEAACGTKPPRRVPKERQPAIRDQPSAAEPYVVESEIPGRVQGLRSRGGTCGGLLAVCPARIIHWDRGALRNADFDLLTVVSPN